MNKKEARKLKLDLLFALSLKTSEAKGLEEEIEGLQAIIDAPEHETGGGIVFDYRITLHQNCTGSFVCIETVSSNCEDSVRSYGYMLADQMPSGSFDDHDGNGEREATWWAEIEELPKRVWR